MLKKGSLIKLPDRLGSLVVGGLDGREDNEEISGSGLVFELGEELEIIQPNGLIVLGKGKDIDGPSQYDFDDDYGDDGDTGGGCVGDCDEAISRKGDGGTRNRLERSNGSGQVSVREVIAADEKKSDLEYVLSQKEINLEKLRKLASTGLPDGCGLRATTWKLLLGYLPASRDLWEKELRESRQKYVQLKEELLLSPSMLTRVKNIDEGSSNEWRTPEGEDAVAGPLKRHELAHEDHPLSVGKASVWNQYFQHTEITEQIDRDLQRTHPDMKFFSGESAFSKKNREAMRNILILFSKLNPAIRYVQGMNEVLAPIFYVFSSDPDERNVANVEADSFSCFVRLLSDSVDHFCQQLDNSPVGILSTLNRLSDLLKVNDEVLWRHLEFTTKVRPQYYGFRWITLLLTQEFTFPSILRIWDSLLSNPSGIQDMLLRICCAMLLCEKTKLLSGDFADNLRLLQHYPQGNVEHLLRVARDLSPDI